MEELIHSIFSNYGAYIAGFILLCLLFGSTILGPVDEIKRKKE